MQKAFMVFKSLNGLSPEYLSDVFINRSDDTNYSLRDSVNKPALPIFLENRGFSYRGAVLWNSSPSSELRQAESLNDFRRQRNS